MPTEWFRNDGSGIAVHVEDENLAIIGDYVPDWVLIPRESPIRGGEKAKVIAFGNEPCPKCKKLVRHLDLGEHLYVAQCKPGCGFLFYQWGSPVDQTKKHRAQISKEDMDESDRRMGELSAEESGDE